MIIQDGPETNRLHCNSSMRVGVGRTNLCQIRNRTKLNRQCNDQHGPKPSRAKLETEPNRKHPERGTAPNRTGADQEPGRTEARPEPEPDRNKWNRTDTSVGHAHTHARVLMSMEFPDLPAGRHGDTSSLH